MAQTRNCVGGCADPVERISKRGADVLIVTGISQSYLNRFKREGVRVVRADRPSVEELLKALVRGELEDMKKGDT